MSGTAKTKAAAKNAGGKAKLLSARQPRDVMTQWTSAEDEAELAAAERDIKKASLGTMENPATVRAAHGLEERWHGQLAAVLGGLCDYAIFGATHDIEQHGLRHIKLKTEVKHPSGALTSLVPVIGPLFRAPVLADGTLGQCPADAIYAHLIADNALLPRLKHDVLRGQLEDTMADCVARLAAGWRDRDWEAWSAPDEMGDGGTVPRGPDPSVVRKPTALRAHNNGRLVLELDGHIVAVDGWRGHVLAIADAAGGSLLASPEPGLAVVFANTLPLAAAGAPAAGALQRRSPVATATAGVSAEPAAYDSAEPPGAAQADVRAAFLAAVAAERGGAPDIAPASAAETRGGGGAVSGGGGSLAGHEDPSAPAGEGADELGDEREEPGIGKGAAIAAAGIAASEGAVDSTSGAQSAGLPVAVRSTPPRSSRRSRGSRDPVAPRVPRAFALSLDTMTWVACPRERPWVGAAQINDAAWLVDDRGRSLRLPHVVTIPTITAFSPDHRFVWVEDAQARGGIYRTLDGALVTARQRPEYVAPLRVLQRDGALTTGASEWEVAGNHRAAALVRTPLGDWRAFSEGVVWHNWQPLVLLDGASELAAFSPDAKHLWLIDNAEVRCIELADTPAIVARWPLDPLRDEVSPLSPEEES